MCVRLTPRALHEPYIEAKDLSPDARQAGHTAECDLCGESVPLEKAVPNPRGEPVNAPRGSRLDRLYTPCLSVVRNPISVFSLERATSPFRVRSQIAR